MLQKYFGDKIFWKDILRLALPIALQNLLMSSFSLVDTIMIGQLGDVSLAAVGMAGQWSWLMNLVMFGLSSGSAVFISQYWGINDVKKIHNIYGILLLHSIGVSVLFTLVGVLSPGFVIKLFNSTPEVIEEGSKYLRYASLSYIGIGLNSVFSTVLRSTEKVKLPMFASGIGTIANAILNYVLIFGKFGFPELGIEGAAVATCISAWISPVVLFIVALIQKNILTASFRDLIRFSKETLLTFYRISTPVIVNESLWGLGTFCYNMIFGNMSYENYAALTIFRTVEGIAFVFFVGLCNACCVMMGKSIGSGDTKYAVSTAKRFSILIPILGFVIGMIMIIFRNPIVHIFNITGAITEVTQVSVKQIMIVYGLELTIRQIPYIQIVGIFRPSGDTKTGLKYDILCVWLIALPLTFISGIILQLPFVAVFGIMLFSEDIIKTILCIRKFRSYKWIKPITEQGKNALE